jgi:hypothetical protein
LNGVDTYRYDLVDVGRQCLSDLTLALLHDVRTAYDSGDAEKIQTASAKFLDLAGDMDTLLGTRHEFLLGGWLESAKAWGTTDAERKLYEHNARWQLTVWGPNVPQSGLDDYSNRQWSGLIRGYYIPRWKKYLDHLNSKVADPGFGKALTKWEYDWCDGNETYPATPSGDAVEISARLMKKWQPIMADAYQRYDIHKMKPIGVDAIVAAAIDLKNPAWTPADCSEDFRDWNLDVSSIIKSPGSYTVTFAYQSGAKALKIESVQLIQKDHQAVVDTHDGWTGLENRENVYHLKVDRVDANTPVILRARVATDGGTDSNGTIQISLK